MKSGENAKARPPTRHTSLVVRRTTGFQGDGSTPSRRCRRRARQPQSFVRTATETADRFRDTWEDAARSLPVTDSVRDAIRRQLDRVPAIADAFRSARIMKGAQGLS